MEFAIRTLGALVVTYVLSRLGLKLIKGRVKIGALMLFLVHLASFAILFVVLGLIRAYFREFESSAAVVYIGPQIAWLLLDLVRLKR